MFIGHYAVGLAAKKFNTKPSLGTYFLAVQFLDLLWPTLLLLHVENVEINRDGNAVLPLTFTHYPVSHSLLTVAAWSVGAGLLSFLLHKNRKTALLLGLCVLSHWFLDLLVHVPDLPLYPGSDNRYGFGLWQLKTVELVIELLLYAAGVLLYYRSTKAINKTGKYAAATLLIFLPVVHLLNQFGPPPPTVSAVAWAGQLQWLIVAWAYWADSGRMANEPEKSSRSATIKTIQQKKPV